MRIINVFLVCTFAWTAVAQTPGTFKATGSMTTPRYAHTATLLADGRVLIAGGRTLNQTLSSAELYDPSTGQFTGTGNMATARSGHTATLLPGGTVLIAGGIGPLGSAELYDPSTGTFSATGMMNTPSSGHTATLLPDGRVLIASGSTASAELYDPSTGTFTPTGSLQAPYYGPSTATLLPDGRVLISGGTSALYDPGTALFTSPQIPLFQFSAAVLMNGKVLLAGGNDDLGEVDLAEVYDPSTGTFTRAGSMTAARTDAPATLLSDGTVLIAGNDGNSGITIASAELYDPATAAFTRTGDMTTDRGLHTATLLNNGKVLITGGVHKVGQSWPTLSSAELYTPSALVPAPALLSLSGDGKGQGAIQHANTVRIASADDPAVAGEYLSIYLTGLADGSVIPPQVAIGGRLAEITFFGNVPGYPGLNVVNIRVPSGVAPGPAVPVRLTYLGRSSNQVTIGVTEVGLQQAVAAMKAATGTDSLNFWQWAWFWQELSAFSGAPAGFGVGGSISPDMMAQIISAGGGDASQNISAEQWIFYYLSSRTAVRGVVSAASYLPGAIAPGELVVVTGSGLGPPQVVSAALDSDGSYAAQLAGTAVLVNGMPAQVVYTSMSQVEAVVPDSVTGGTAQVTVTYQGQTSASFPVPVAPTAPGIFTADGTGRGPAATINQKGLINAPAHWEGDVMTLFLTGTGHLGVAIYGSQQLPILQGTVPGVTQIKLPIPFGTDCDFLVVFQVGNVSTQPGVGIPVDICI